MEGDQEADRQEDHVLQGKVHLGIGHGHGNGQHHVRIEKTLQPRVDLDHPLAEIPDHQLQEDLGPQTLEDQALKTSIIKDEQSEYVI